MPGMNFNAVRFRIRNLIFSLHCKEKTSVRNIAVCKTGKHGSAKYHFTGKDIFTQKKYEEMFMCHESVQVPNVTKTLMQLLFIEDDGHLQLMSDASSPVRYDLVLQLMFGLRVRT